MNPVRSVSSHRVLQLQQGWELAFTAPGAAKDPAQLAALRPEWLPAQVPGTAATALRALGRWSFDQERDFDAEDVWYRCRLQPAPPAAGAAPSVRALRFDGLATLADAWLDGAHLLRSENMFLAHAVALPAPAGAEPPPGELLLRFASLKQALAAKRPRPRWKTRLVEQQQLRWFRTTLLGRIPGWSPPAAAAGPWRGVFLEEREALLVEQASLRSGCDGAGGTVEAALRLRLLPGTAVAAAFLEAGGERAQLAIEAIAGGEAPGGGSAIALSGSVRLAAAPRWWPHTHGPQPLVPVRVVLERAGAAPVVLDCGRTGFRTVEADRGAGGFTLVVNGEPVFCRGACWTPLDVAALRAEPAAIRAALEQARDAGMNMLRVGGTMVYEDAAFHDLCDELGLLVFQDFQLANLDYPAQDPAFAASLRAEAGQFLGRTQLSPSLAVLCGGSEVEQQAAMLGLPAQARDEALAPLFDRLLPEACAAARPDVPYARNSPTGGALPFQVDSGLSHYYGVGAYLRPLEDARRAGVRFASECLAFANVPAQETLDGLLSDGQRAPHHPRWKRRVPRDSGAGWDFDDVRDHYLKSLFGIDPLALRYADPERYLALSRVVTGEVMAATLGEWRRGASGCRGALVWFLRDLWPGAGWGVLDSLGRPKAAWWYLRRALQPVGLHLSDEGLNGLRLHAFNDGPEPVQTTLRAWAHRRSTLVGEGLIELALPARGEATVQLDALFDGFRDLAWAYRFGPPGQDLLSAALLGADGAQLAEAFHFPAGRAGLLEADPGLEGQLLPARGGWELRLRTRALAHSVALEVEGGAPADDFFHLRPGSTRTVVIRPTSEGAPRVVAWPLNSAAPVRCSRSEG